MTTALVLIAISAISSHSLFGQTHPFLSNEFSATFNKLRAPWMQQVDNRIDVVCEAISKAYGITIWIDPNLARDQQIRVGKDRETLGDMLDDCSRLVNATVVPIEGVIMIVPRNRADSIATHYWKNRRSNVKANWLKVDSKPFGWESGTKVQKVAESFCSKHGIPKEWVANLEPDLWPQFEFQKTNVMSIGTCILSGMSMDWDLSKSPVEVSPFKVLDEGATQVDWSYDRVQMQQLGEAHTKQWKSRFPKAKFMSSGQNWKVTATALEHLALMSPLIKAVTYVKPTSENSVYQGELQGSLGQALGAIAKSMNLEFAPWPLPDAVASRQIHVKYNNATVDKILQDIADAGKIKLTRNGAKCEITIP